MCVCVRDCREISLQPPKEPAVALEHISVHYLVQLDNNSHHLSLSLPLTHPPHSVLPRQSIYKAIQRCVGCLGGHSWQKGLISSPSYTMMYNNFYQNISFLELNIAKYGMAVRACYIRGGEKTAWLYDWIAIYQIILILQTSLRQVEDRIRWSS